MSLDAVDENIEALLTHATDPENRAVLMVLLKIAAALDDNTAVTRTLAADIDSHRKEFAKHQAAFSLHVHEEGLLLAKGIGAWKTMGVVLGLVLSLGGYIVSTHLGQLTDTVHSDAEQNKIIYNAVQRIGALERDVETLRGLLRK